MYASPELYYDIEYRQHERALENAAAYRRAAELSPAQVVPNVSVLSRVVTLVTGVVRRLRRSISAVPAGTELAGTVPAATEPAGTESTSTEPASSTRDNVTTVESDTACADTACEKTADAAA